MGGGSSKKVEAAPPAVVPPQQPTSLPATNEPPKPPPAAPTEIPANIVAKKEEVVIPTTSTPITSAEPEVFTFPAHVKPEDYFKTVHSAIRWQKPNVSLILAFPGTVDCLDAKTGNVPIHIAAQNGYMDIVRILLDKSCAINAVNKKGNSAMHMAMAYDYHEVVYALIANGADVNLKNDSGFPASRGLEGDKSLALLALVAAKDEASILAAMDMCAEKADEVEKSAFIAMCLGRKKELGQEKWTDSVKTKMTETMDKLPSK